MFGGLRWNGNSKLFPSEESLERGTVRAPDYYVTVQLVYRVDIHDKQRPKTQLNRACKFIKETAGNTAQYGTDFSVRALRPVKIVSVL